MRIDKIMRQYYGGKLAELPEIEAVFPEIKYRPLCRIWHFRLSLNDLAGFGVMAMAILHLIFAGRLFSVSTLLPMISLF
jgi:hypothetical protein